MLSIMLAPGIRPTRDQLHLIKTMTRVDIQSNGWVTVTGPHGTLNLSPAHVVAVTQITDEEASE